MTKQKSLTVWRTIAIVAMLALALVSVSYAIGIDWKSWSQIDSNSSLSYWTDDSSSKEVLTSYMKEITDKNSDSYIPVEDRIAVFDMDGTLYCETDPSYFDRALYLHRVLDDKSYKATVYDKKIANKIMNSTATEIEHGQGVANAFKGMTLDELYRYIAKFKKTPMNSYKGMNVGDAWYQPMVQVINYLKDNDFKVYIVSGTDRFLVRGLVADSPIDIPNSQIIGSDESLVAPDQGNVDGLDYTYDDDDELVLGGTFYIKNLKMNKVTVIEQEIGTQPVLSFGNSSGDASMAEFATTNNKYKSLAFMVCCDDTKRENGNVEKANEMYKMCDEFDWVPISMKNDWKTIYGDDVTYTKSK